MRKKRSTGFAYMECTPPFDSIGQYNYKTSRCLKDDEIDYTLRNPNARVGSSFSLVVVWY